MVYAIEAGCLDQGRGEEVIGNYLHLTCAVEDEVEEALPAVAQAARDLGFFLEE